MSNRLTDQDALAAAGSVQNRLDPRGQLLPRPAGCRLVACLPVLADADMEMGGLPVIDGGPASGALGLIHTPIIGMNKCVDKYYEEVFNVNTLNTKAQMKTFQAGQTYQTRSICDADCIIRVTIASRTAKTVKTTDGKTFRVAVYGDAEFIKPWGSYSMSPRIQAA